MLCMEATSCPRVAGEIVESICWTWWLERSSSRRKFVIPRAVRARMDWRRSAGRRGAVNPSTLFELGENAAEIAGIKVQVRRKLGCGNTIAMCDLIEQTDFGQRERAVEKS